MPRAAEIEKPKRKVNPEELTKRLYYQQEERSKANEEKRQNQLKANETRLLLSNKKLTRETEGVVVERLYVQQMNKMEQTKEKHLKQLEEAAKSRHQKQLSPSELMDVVSRMYSSEVERRRAHEDALTKKYQPPPQKKVLEATRVKEVNARLHDECKGKREENRQKLYEKHCAGDLPPIKKLSKEKQMEMAARLCTAKS